MADEVAALLNATRARLRAAADPEFAAGLRWFFKEPVAEREFAMFEKWRIDMLRTGRIAWCGRALAGWCCASRPRK